MTINNILVDVARGFKAFRGSQLRGEFADYAEATLYIKNNPGCWLQYWLKKEED